jgi:enoyl-[acyl-carrier-protein] reductase (NADH)
MIQLDLSGKSALITGGTKGIGLGIALKFGEAGTRTYLTHWWDTEDHTPIYKAFEKRKAPKPTLIESDVSFGEDTEKLLASVKKNEKKIDFFVSNVGVAQRTMDLDEYKKRSLFKTLEYSTWPLIEYTRKIKETFGSYPRHIVGISSSGPDNFYQGYDFVAASKALLEVFAKYLSVHLFNEGSRVNVIRFGPVDTESFSLIFGKDFFPYLKDQGIPEEMIMTPEDCGNTVVALCSGLLDALNGQIITADKGMNFRDNFMMHFLKSKEKKS